MDQITQNVFNELIEPYAVNNKAGQRVGFDCDLDAMAQRASSIVNQFGIQQQVAQQQAAQQTIATPNPKAEVAQPSVDMNTESNNARAEYPEPKNLEEALKIVYAEKEKQ